MPASRVEFVTACIAGAKNSECKIKHAALVARGNTVLAIATNKRKTHIRRFNRGPRVSGFDIMSKTYHAEQVALLRSNGRVKGSVLYSFRDHIRKMSRPCEDCIEMAHRLGIKLVVYSAGPCGKDCTVEGHLAEFRL